MEIYGPSVGCHENVRKQLETAKLFPLSHFNSLTTEEPKFEVCNSSPKPLSLSGPDGPNLKLYKAYKRLKNDPISPKP